MSVFAAATLVKIDARGGAKILELIGLLLPCPVAFYANFDASKDHLFSSSEIYSKLADVAIFDGKLPGFCVWLAQSDMVEKGSARTCNILEVPLTIDEAELAVLSTDYLTLEPDRCIRWSCGIGRGNALPF